MAEFLQQSFWRQEGYFYYDFLLRDFFRYLLGRSNGYVFAPGTSKLIALGDAWYSRCESARDRAIKACEYEYSDYVISAGEEWQKIFGNQIPVNVRAIWHLLRRRKNGREQSRERGWWYV